MRVQQISLWVEVIAFLVLYAFALICCWPMTAISGWSMRLVIQLGALLLLAVLITGQFARHRHRLTLKGMLLLVSLAAVLCALFGHRLVVANRQRALAAIIMSAGGRVEYDIDGGWGTAFKTKTGLLLPNWTRRITGDGFFGNLKTAWFNRTLSEATLLAIDRSVLSSFNELHFHRSPIGDRGVAHLSDLPALSTLSLQGTNVSDKSLQALHKLPSLRTLVLINTNITDAGLPSLTKFNQLEVVYLSGTNVTEAGLAELRASLPRCTIKCDY
jgi:hypothetical protein